MDLLLQGSRTTNTATGLRGFHANSVASAGLLLRSHQRGLHPGGKRRYRAAAKELFDARYRYSHRSGAARITYALSAQGEICNLLLRDGRIRSSLRDYAFYVKGLAKRCKQASFERFQLCVVDSTERRDS